MKPTVTRRPKVERAYVSDIKVKYCDRNLHPVTMEFTLMIYNPGFKLEDNYRALVYAASHGIPVSIFPSTTPEPCEATHAPEVLKDE